MDTSLLEQLMTKISLCLSNVMAHERLQFFAYHDPLTGILNRRAFEKEADKALYAAKSKKRRQRPNPKTGLSILPETCRLLRSHQIMFANDPFVNPSVI